MQRIEDWLAQIGLERYAVAFANNDIDVAVLPHLTDADLEKIGVSLGHRRKILAAIAELRGTIPAPLQHHDSAERRQLTVMFCDLVGSTALATQLDPEDLREIIAAYRDGVAAVVRKYGGTVSRYIGDGMLILFGHPSAHEDDAERAVRAALEIATGAHAPGAPPGLELRVRLGLATGLVIVGDLIGSEATEVQAVLGETPNLAARLQALAEPDGVVIAEDTRRLIGGLFDYQDLGAVMLKGFAAPVRVWSVLREGTAESRFEALHPAALTPLMGREEELELLERCWRRARTGAGQVVLLVGERGIGKSRLTAALMERLAGEPHTRWRLFCSPQHTDSALYPIIGLLERAAGLVHGDAPRAKLDKLDAMLALTRTPVEEVALLAEMLSLANDGRYPALDLAPPQRRQRTLQALVSQLETLSRQSPVLMIFEDAHWTDPTSLELLGRAIDRIATFRVLLIVTFRPEFNPPWIGRPHVTAVTIDRLDQREVRAMIDSVVGNKLLPANVREDIIERSDGIPLFVEEMTKAVLEAESEGEARRTAGAVPSPGLAVPASLHASLMARLDRLGPAKEVAQVGAAIGREFSHALLAAVVRKPEPQVASALDRLMVAGLLSRQGMPPHATYVFKHALVQDAAYGTLLREPRRALHACIAETLETQFAEIAENQPGLLARHCGEAGLIEKAAHLWGKAGLRSLARSALVEAVEQLKRALAQMAASRATPALRREQIKLQVALVNALMHVEGYAAVETKEAVEQARLLIERAEALGEPPEDPLLLFSVLYGFWSVYYVGFNGDVVRNLAAQFLALAERQSATVPLMIGHRIMGTALVFTGDVAHSRACFDRALALYNPAEHRLLVTRFGQDVGVTILCYRSMALWMLGYPQAALADAERAVEGAREIGHAATLMFALFVTAISLICCGRHVTAKAQLDELVALAEEKSTLIWKGFGGLLQGWLCSLTGRPSDAIQMLTSAIAAGLSSGTTQVVPTWLSLCATAYADVGKLRRRVALF